MDVCWLSASLDPDVKIIWTHVSNFHNIKRVTSACHISLGLYGGSKKTKDDLLDIVVSVSHGFWHHPILYIHNDTLKFTKIGPTILIRAKYYKFGMLFKFPK